MTFVEALAEYHKGKRIRRKEWHAWMTFSLRTIAHYHGRVKDFDDSLVWDDVLSTDWIAEDE